MNKNLVSLYNDNNILENKNYKQYLGIYFEKYLPIQYISKKITKIYCNRKGKDKSKKKIKEFIKEYNINWKIAKKCKTQNTKKHVDIDSCVDKFDDLNDFFSREVDSSFISISKAHKNKELRITSPAECRSRVVHPIEGDKNGLFLIKNIKYSIMELIDKQGIEWVEQPKSAIIFRLIPSDYHRLHSPVDCTIYKIFDLGNKYYSVNKILVESERKVLQKNVRKVLLIKLKDGTKGAVVIIGATCISSIIMPKQVNDVLNKGDYFSHFEFGGSALMLILNKNVNWNKKLNKRSLNNLETYLQPGNWIGDII